MTTFQQIVDRARVPLNDAAKTRYPDADLMEGANRAMSVLRAKRPDLFFGVGASWDTVTTYVLADNFPIEDIYRTAVEDFITSWAELRDDEDAMQQRASTFFQLFNSML